MVGMFKLMDGDQVVFYELMLLIEHESSLSLYVKHFNADFTAWESRDDFVDFELVRVDHDAVHFPGLSFYRRSADRLDGYIIFRSGENLVEEKLTYRRVPGRTN